MREARRAEYQAEKAYRAQLSPARRVGLEGRQWRRDSLENEPWVAPHLSEVERAAAARRRVERWAQLKWWAITVAIVIGVTIWRVAIPMLQELGQAD
ncbi:hypothetical protein GCM10017562_34730 [Streptomyces roseofulvus]|uniref:hypothetical protein n=1 Tax=Streptomyces roseofulvus TaxID=33902 RepID=UPI0031FCC015